jgi:hypothetical protein
MSIAFVVLASLLGAQAKGAAEAVPITVMVELPAEVRPDLAEWAGELRRALEARKDEFRLVKPETKADLVVRLDSIGQGSGGTPTLRLVLVRGDETRSFTYTFGDVRADAEKLARNLRRLADKMEAGGK